MALADQRGLALHRSSPLLDAAALAMIIAQGCNAVIGNDNEESIKTLGSTGTALSKLAAPV